MQTLQTLSSSRSMLTNCSSFIVPCGGCRGGDKRRDGYFNRSPREAPAAPRLRKRHAPPPAAAPAETPGPPRQAGRGEKERGSVPGKFLLQSTGVAAWVAATPHCGSGVARDRALPPPPRPRTPSPPLEAALPRPVPTHSPPQAPSSGSPSPVSPRTDGADAPPQSEPRQPRSRSPPRRATSPAPHATIVRPPAPPPPELSAKHRPPLPAGTTAPVGRGGREDGCGSRQSWSRAAAANIAAERNNEGW